MKKVFLVAVTILLVAAFAFVGCAKPAPAPAPPPAPAPAPPPAPDKHGGIYVFNYGLPADRIGVPLNIIHYNHVYAEFALESLIQPSNEEVGVHLPRLATSWELAPDKSSYTFHLRKGVKFHDGTDFNAQAAKWNIDSWLAGHTPLLDKVTSVDIIDDYTIRCNLSSWDSILMDDFARGSQMISPTAYEKNGEEWANYHPIGTGPFKLKEFKRNQILKWERNEDYWNEDLPYLDEMHILQVPDPMTATAMIKAGEVQALYQIDPVTASQLQATGGYIVDVFPGLHQVIVMNTKDPNSVWSDKRMREALEYAVDKEAITKAVGYGFMRPYYEIIHSLHEAGGKPGTVPRKYDPEKARQLMAEAGYPDGVKVTMTISSEQPRDQFVAVQGNLAKVGIVVELNPVSMIVLNQMSFEPPEGNDLRIEAQRGGTLNPLGSTKETLSSRTIYFPGLKRPEGFEELLQQALAETDPGKAMKLLEQMEKLAYDDVMFVPLWNMPILTVADRSANDIVWSYGGTPSPRLEWAWLSEK